MRHYCWVMIAMMVDSGGRNREARVVTVVVVEVQGVGGCRLKGDRVGGWGGGGAGGGGEEDRRRR